MSDREQYVKGPIDVEFYGLPTIDLVSINLKSDSQWYQRIAEATVRRYFTLVEDWKIKLDRVSYNPEINGTIIIPRKVESSTDDIVFDGASVPMPWLVSFLSIGILRPLGVMLTASIVHDFAYKYGYLLVQDSTGEKKKVEIERHKVDMLFRDIISTVNQVAVIGWLAWFFVRVGWFLGVEYNGRKYGGQKPKYIILFLVVVLVTTGIYLFEGYQTQVDRINNIVFWMFIIYIIFYLMSIVVLKFKKARIE